jgi:1-deoxy-D-xylulose-5-phosphate synthase
MAILETINTPEDLTELTYEQLNQLAEEIRNFIVKSVSSTGGHLGSNLGIVELTIALHRVFSSPHDIILFDTGHQAYIHKLLTGRREHFKTLRQENGLSGYPNRSESVHDWIENSHASTALSYAFGISESLQLQGIGVKSNKISNPRKVIAVVGDGALTGGMAYEALNNIGHKETPVIIVLNDNGRSYAPTISKLSSSLSQLRSNPSYIETRERIRKLVKELPLIHDWAYAGIHGITSALREVIEPHVFFESLGIRYVGPFDGHNIEQVEQALRNATVWKGPILLHFLTHKGKGFAPAEEDDVQRLHDIKAVISHPNSTAEVAHTKGDSPVTYTDTFSAALIKSAEADENVVAITAAMPGPTGLLPFQAKFPERFIDVGIAEQHAVTAAAGIAMAGMKPVVAVYSTFLTRAFDQLNFDVGLHNLNVTFALDRAGITGDDGPSHHGVLDMVLSLAIPNMAVFAPSSAFEMEPMLEAALGWDGPSTIRYPKTPALVLDKDEIGIGLNARLIDKGNGQVAILAVGKMVEYAIEAVELLKNQGLLPTLYDVRIVKPLDKTMLETALQHETVMTIEDGYSFGGAGSYISSKLRELSAITHQPMPAMEILGIPTVYIPQAKPVSILSRFGLDSAGIAASVLKLMERLKS